MLHVIVVGDRVAKGRHSLDLDFVRVAIVAHKKVIVVGIVVGIVFGLKEPGGSVSGVFGLSSPYFSDGERPRAVGGIVFGPSEVLVISIGVFKLSLVVDEPSELILIPVEHSPF